MIVSLKQFFNTPSASLQWFALGLALAIIFVMVVFWTSLGRHKYQAKPILTPNEVEFFQRIRRAAPDLYIFPQVSMAAFMEPAARNKEGRRWLDDFRRISQKRIDYGIFSQKLELLAIIELDDKTHDKAQDAQRDGYTRSAGIKTLRFESRARPTILQLRSAIAECINAH